MRLLQLYLAIGIAICLWFSLATSLHWRAPDTGFMSGGSRGGVYYGRGYGGSWGGGK